MKPIEKERFDRDIYDASCIDHIPYYTDGKLNTYRSNIKNLCMAFEHEEFTLWLCEKGDTGYKEDYESFVLDSRYETIFIRYEKNENSRK